MTDRNSAGTTRQTHTERSVVRVPDPSALFWAAKAASTALGEAASDFAIRAMNPVLAVILGFALFVAALGVQLSRRAYVVEWYWFAVAAVGVFGTMAADVMHVVVGLPYAVSATLAAVCLAGVFVGWWRAERTLSVHDITTDRREWFYWAAVIGTFALGTAAGDLVAVGLGLGYVAAIVVFAALIALPALGYRFAHLNGVFAFWAAYVLTRPLGASVADWLGKPTEAGGVGVGSGLVTLAFALALAALVVVMRRRARGGRATPTR